jgi:hypothetical protein
MERDLASFSTWQYVVPNSASSCPAESRHPVKLPAGRAAGSDSLTSRSLAFGLPVHVAASPAAPFSAPVGMTIAF